jgi:hypothetical protein
VSDYFLVSSPLHFLIAANISLQSEDHERVLLIVARDAAMADRFRLTAEKHPDIFNRVVVLPHDAHGSRRIRGPRFQTIKAQLADISDARIFTGNDRRLEFQYAMHVASQAGSRPKGVYMDEGAVTYFGHKSMGSFAHRTIDPLVKRLFIGRWYKPALTTGASDWIETIYAAFPEHVHPLLKPKELVRIAPEPFSLSQFKALARDLLPDGEEYAEALQGVKLVVTLPHEASYLGAPQTYEAVSRSLLDHFAPSQVAIKPHPRITNRQVLQQIFPGTAILEPTTGMEVLLTLLDDDCLVAGDISSTLLTTKWLRPALPVVALMVHDAPPKLMTDLYTALGIPMMTPADLPQWLCSI